ncbi:calphotin-like isoform X1 [Acanthaster planci]|uniref:Calphotin-like isoform X1 n=1 Tax=Acanthaster planci TaxID=133434 RepID=A0A8B7Y6R8_ACAPL|nr:calphotin-like isoform X1 [Acanthaster planci]
MPRKTRSETQSPATEPRRRSSRLAALPQTSPEPKPVSRAQKTPTSAEKPERRGRPAGSIKKTPSPKKETRGRKRKAQPEPTQDEEPESKTSKEDTEELAEVTREDEKAVAAGDSKKEGEDAPDAQSDEKNGKAENVDSKDEKMETNQDKAQTCTATAKTEAQPTGRTPVHKMPNPVVKITAAEIPQKQTSAPVTQEVNKPAAMPAAPPQVIKATPAPAAAPPTVQPMVAQSPPKMQTVQSVPKPPMATLETSQAKEPSAPSRTEAETSAPAPVVITSPVVIPVESMKPVTQPDPKPQQQPEVVVVDSSAQKVDESVTEKVVSPPTTESVEATAVSLAQEPTKQQQQQTVAPQTEVGQSMAAGQVDLPSAHRKCPPSLPPLQFLTKPEITITPASDAEPSPTPGTPGGAELDESEEKVTEKPVEEPTKEQDVPNDAAPSESIDSLKKDAVQHDGMNNGESVAPAAAAVAV